MTHSDRQPVQFMSTSPGKHARLQLAPRLYKRHLEVSGIKLHSGDQESPVCSERMKQRAAMMLGASLGTGGVAVSLGDELIGQAVQTAAAAGLIAALILFGAAYLSDGFVGD